MNNWRDPLDSIFSSLDYPPAGERIFIIPRRKDENKSVQSVLRNLNAKTPQQTECPTDRRGCHQV